MMFHIHGRVGGNLVERFVCVNVADMETQLSGSMIAHEYRGPFWLKVSLAIDTNFFPPPSP